MASMDQQGNQDSAQLSTSKNLEALPPLLKIQLHSEVGFKKPRLLKAPPLLFT
jgi:hypothetical protein